MTPEESQAAGTLTQLTWQQPVLRSVSPASTTSDVDVVGTQRHRQQDVLYCIVYFTLQSQTGS